MTLVERSGSLRSSGSPVDVRGPAVDVAERMNIATHLRAASIHLKGMTLLDSGGRRVARVEENTAADGIVLSEDQLDRLNNLAPAAGERHDEANMARIDR